MIYLSKLKYSFKFLSKKKSNQNLKLKRMSYISHYERYCKFRIFNCSLPRDTRVSLSSEAPILVPSKILPIILTVVPRKISALSPSLFTMSLSMSLLSRKYWQICGCLQACPHFSSWHRHCWKRATLSSHDSRYFPWNPKKIT